MDWFCTSCHSLVHAHYITDMFVVDVTSLRLMLIIFSSDLFYIY